MSPNETPLVLFTVCSQMAVGAFVVLGLVQVFVARTAAKHGNREAVDALADPALFAIGPVLALGLVASLLHLGSPLRAANSLRHLGTSWLSAEIVFGLAFAALGALFAFLQWRKLGSVAVRQVVAGITAVTGLGLVYASARVYMLTAQPAWDSWFTLAQFFATTLLLGSLAVAVAFVATSAFRASRGTAQTDSQELLGSSLRWTSGLAICALGIVLITLPIYLVQLAGKGPNGQVILDTLLADSLGMLIARLVLAFVGAGLLSVFLYRAASAGERTGAQLRILVIITTSAFVLAFVSEILGRYVFYSLQLHGFFGTWS